VTSRVRHLTFDCRDPHLLARFWAAAIGYVDDPEDPNHPDDPEALLVDPAGLGPGLLFVPVPEGKQGKNRLHLDLQPDQPREAEVQRLLDLGATLVDDRRDPDGTGWAVLADPEGNELCVERSAAERGTPPPRDTGERDWDFPLDADESTVLRGILDWYRAGVLAKVDGVSQAVATTRPLRSKTSIAALVHHLARVEDSWLHHRVGGHPRSEPFASAPGREWEFDVVDELPFAEVVDRYRRACDRSRAALDGRAMDDHAVHAVDGEDFTVRFALVHLVEETARHLGHLDILRELLDGTTGE